jgi:hypothetical protein
MDTKNILHDYLKAIQISETEYSQFCENQYGRYDYVKKVVNESFNSNYLVLDNLRLSFQLYLRDVANLPDSSVSTSKWINLTRCYKEYISECTIKYALDNQILRLLTRNMSYISCVDIKGNAFISKDTPKHLNRELLFDEHFPVYFSDFFIRINKLKNQKVDIIKRYGEYEVKTESYSFTDNIYVGMVDLSIIEKYLDYTGLPYHIFISNSRNAYRDIVYLNSGVCRNLEIYRFHILMAIRHLKSSNPDKKKYRMDYVFNYFKLMFREIDFPQMIQIGLFEQLITLSSAFRIEKINNEPFVNLESGIHDKTFLLKGLEDEIISHLKFRPDVELIFTNQQSKTYLNIIQMEIYHGVGSTVAISSSSVAAISSSSVAAISSSSVAAISSSSSIPIQSSSSSSIPIQSSSSSVAAISSSSVSINTKLSSEYSVKEIKQSSKELETQLLIKSMPSIPSLSQTTPSTHQLRNDPSSESIISNEKRAFIKVESSKVVHTPRRPEPTPRSPYKPRQTKPLSDIEKYRSLRSNEDTLETITTSPIEELNENKQLVPLILQKKPVREPILIPQTAPITTNITNTRISICSSQSTITNPPDQMKKIIKRPVLNSFTSLISTEPINVDLPVGSSQSIIMNSLPNTENMVDDEMNIINSLNITPPSRDRNICEVIIEAVKKLWKPVLLNYIHKETRGYIAIQATILVKKLQKAGILDGKRDRADSIIVSNTFKEIETVKRNTIIGDRDNDGKWCYIFLLPLSI